MNKIYEDEGKYDLINQIPKILYSNIICTVINIIAKTLSLSQKDILKLKTHKKEEKGENLHKKAKKIKKCLFVKFILFYIISFYSCLFFGFMFLYSVLFIRIHNYILLKIHLLVLDHL